MAFSPVEVPQILRGRLHSLSFSSAQSSRLFTGARAESYGQIVDVPTPQIQERVSERVVGQIVVSGSAPDLRVQALPTVAHRPAESVLLRFTELFHPLSSIWYFFHPGSGRTQVLTPLDGHYPFFMLHKRRCYFRRENSRQSILDAWTCLGFCEHAQARRVFLLCHGSASCVHGKRR